MSDQVTTDAVRPGRCFCGNVRFRMRGAPMFVHCCHCRDCQQQSGSAFVVNGLIEADRIELVTGEPKPVRMATESGHPHDIYRCDSCQSALWSDYGGRDWLRFVRLATLDEPAAFSPDVHIFTRSRLPWVILPAEAAVFAEYYDVRIQGRWKARDDTRWRRTGLRPADPKVSSRRQAKSRPTIPVPWRPESITRHEAAVSLR